MSPPWMGTRNLKVRRLGWFALLCFLLSSVLPAAVTLYAMISPEEDEALPPHVDLLAALLTIGLEDVDRACVIKLSQDYETMMRMRKILHENPGDSKVRKFVAAEFGSCGKLGDEEDNAQTSPHQSVAEQAIQTKTSPCHMRGEDRKLGPHIRISGTPPTFSEIEKVYPEMSSGGFYPGPKNCATPTHSTLFILPYRNRETHLRYWLYYMIAVLMKQKIRFQIIVVEQEDVGVFNKGQLMNTGFKWAMANVEHVWDCVVFHDVDMISEVYGTIYECRNKGAVIHYAGYINKFNYTVKKVGLTVGGAVGFTEHLYQLVNGYSNMYWGWGGEDDDMYIRLRKNSIKLVRYKSPLGRYKMIHHNRDEGNPTNRLRHRLLRAAPERMTMDGLTNLATEVISVQENKLFTKLVVKVDQNTDPPPPAYEPQSKKKDNE